MFNFLAFLIFHFSNWFYCYDSVNFVAITVFQQHRFTKKLQNYSANFEDRRRQKIAHNFF